MIPFSTLKYSTKTIIAVTNMNINLDLFHQNIPYLNYSFPKKKRGRKKEIRRGKENHRHGRPAHSDG